MKRMINWQAMETTKEEYDLIGKIAKRWAESSPLNPANTQLSTFMDLQVVHDRIGLDLEKLLNFSEGNFVHDMQGIRIHLDRTTGEVRNKFVPRSARSS
jgi:hypothetical protein